MLYQYVPNRTALKYMKETHRNVKKKKKDKSTSLESFNTHLSVTDIANGKITVR